MHTKRLDDFKKKQQLIFIELCQDQSKSGYPGEILYLQEK